jgi:type IX secretion system PorP/SprF family membrane protein
MKRILLYSCILWAVVNNAFGQAPPVINNFYLNPFFYNPAFAGMEHRPSLYMNHRVQWLGFEGAPVTSALSFHTPMGLSNSAIGLNVYSDKRGILNHTNAMFTYAYKVPLSQSNSLRFGLSTGIFQNNINFSDIDYDPIVAKYDQKPLFMDAQFGANLNLGKLNLGFALPNLIENKALDSEQQQMNFGLAPLNAWTINASYRFDLKPGKLTFEPYAVYRQPLNQPQFYEVAAVFHINDVLYLGAANRQYGGVSGLLGINYKDLYSVGYAYEVPAFQNYGPTGTHEVQLNIHLGYRIDKKYKIEELGEEHHEHVARFIVETDEERRDRLIELEKGYFYVIAATFQYFDDAEKMLIRFKKKGLKEAKMGHNAVSKKYYIWVFHTDNMKKAIREQKRVAHKHRLKKAKVIKIK